MSTKRVEVTIKGISALLMHRYPLEPIEALELKEIAEQVELAAYRTPDGQLYVPGIAIQRAIVQGATFSKGKGRASLQKVVCACAMIDPEYCLLTPQTYRPDTRPVVIPATKGRVLRHRPRFDEWEVSFGCDYDDTLLTEDQLRRVFDDTGSRVGLLDFRPEKKGPFGRFMVTRWQPV